jgi:hypothetical protein
LGNGDGVRGAGDEAHYDCGAVMMGWEIECVMESESMQGIWMADEPDDYQGAHKSQSHAARGVHGIGLSYDLDLLGEESVYRSLGPHDHGHDHCLLVLLIRDLTALGVSHCRALVRGFGLALFVVARLLRLSRPPAVLRCCQKLLGLNRCSTIPFLGSIQVSSLLKAPLEHLVGCLGR